MPRLLHVIDELRHTHASAQLAWQVDASAQSLDEQPIVAVGRRPAKGLDLQCRTEWLGRRFSVDPFAARRLARLVRVHAPAAVQAWDIRSADLVRALHRFGALRGARWIARFDGGPFPRASATASHVFATDEHAAESAAAVVGAQRVTVVRNSSPRLQWTTDAAAKLNARRRLHAAGVDLPDGAPCVLIMSRCRDAVGLKQLLWASDLLRVVRPGLRVMVVGDGPARATGQRFAGAALEPGLVHWLGDQPDLATCHQAADIAWVEPGADATPNSAIMAVAANLPLVIASSPSRSAFWEASPLAAVVDAGDRTAWPRASSRLLDGPPSDATSAAWRRDFLAKHHHETASRELRAAVCSVMLA